MTARILETDDFNRADETPLSDGGAWSIQTGEDQFNLVTNAATPNSLAGDSSMNRNDMTWPNDQYSQAKITVVGTGNLGGVGVTVRASSSARTYYIAYVNKAATNNVTVRKRIAGTPTTLRQSTVTWIDGDTLRLEVQGTTLRVYQNGTQIGADITGQADIASGRVGIAHSTVITSGSLDDWEGGTFNLPTDFSQFPKPKISDAIARGSM